MNLGQLIGRLQLRIAELEEALAARPAGAAPKRTPRPGTQSHRVYQVVAEHGGEQGLTSAEICEHVPELRLNYVCALVASIDGLERIGERRHYRYRVKA